MSGDGKDAGQETADEVHPPCPPVEPKTEELHREDDRGTLAQEICSSAAMSGDGKDAGQETADEVHPPIPCPPVEPKAEELDREGDRGTELHGHGSPEKVPQACSIKRIKKRSDPCECLDLGGSLTNEWFKMRTFDASGDAAVVQGGAAATGNTGSGQGTSCWPFNFSCGSKKAKTK